MSKTDALAQWVDRLGRGRASKLARWKGLLTFSYHRIGTPDATVFDRELWSATAEGFDEQVSFLRKNFDVLRIEDVKDAERSKSGRNVLLAFDDGYRDNYEFALPVLRRHGATAVFFITTGFVDRGGLSWWDELAWMVMSSRLSGIAASRWLPEAEAWGNGGRDAAIRRLLRIYYQLTPTETGPFMEWLGVATGSGRYPVEEGGETWMTWDMVRELRKAGMGIGGHTVNHPVLSRLTRAEQADEIRGCAKRLDEELHEPMRWFAFPVGKPDTFNADTHSVLREVGVELAFSYYGGLGRWNDWNPLDIRRVSVEMGTTPAMFRATAAFPAFFGPPANNAGWGTRVWQTATDLA